MSDTWETVGMSDVGPGDRVRYREYEFTIARVDSLVLPVLTLLAAASFSHILAAR